MVAPRRAWADCPTSPVNWDAADCNVGGTPVCAGTDLGGGLYRWDCDVSDSDEAAEVTTVSDYDGNQIASWGEKDGEEFCCPMNNGIVIVVNTFGSDHDDTLTHSFPAESAVLEEYVAYGAYAMTATIWGGSGDDTIKGSPTDHVGGGGSLRYTEILYGEDNADTIQGFGGQDLIYGGAKNDVIDGGTEADTIYGEDGNDTIDGGDHGDHIYGGVGDDTIRGGAGDDTIDGGDGEDRISGGGDDDTINGGPGGDIICGDAESSGDYIDDGDDGIVTPMNQIWAANAADVVTCGASNTRVDLSSDSDGCVVDLTAKPSYCP
jgi:Ca2+-binding RTX toxin-like protein